MERAVVKGAWDPVTFGHRMSIELRLRHLERMALGTPYPEMVRRAVAVVQSPVLSGRCELIVDATGVGRPVVDLLRDAKPGCRIRPVVVTGGLRETEEGGYHHVPKRDLISGVQVLLQGGRLQISSRMEYGAALIQEMTEMRVKVTATGNEQMGSWREGSHDDLVFAVALACWGEERCRPRAMYGRERLF